MTTCIYKTRIYHPAESNIKHKSPPKVRKAKMMMEKIILVTIRKAIRAKRSKAGNAAMLAIEQKMKVQEMQRLHLGSRKRFHERERESTAPNHAFWGLSTTVLEVFLSELRRHTYISKKSMAESLVCKAESGNFSVVGDR